MFFANSSNILIGSVMAAILVFALISVIRTARGGGCSCGCVTGRSCDGDCPHCDCTDCAGNRRQRSGRSRKS